MHVLRNKNKHKGIKRFYYSTKYAIEGLIYAYKNEHSLWIHAALSFIAVVLGLTLDISLHQWSILLISLGAVLAFELVNTAMEACIDMCVQEFNPLAKVAKDCCSGATFVTSMISAIIAGVIFLPKILALLEMI